MNLLITATIRFSETGDNYDYSEKNLEIKNTLKPVSNFRLGGEFRFNKMYFRGGYGYYGKVFKTGEVNDDMFNRSISFGAGFQGTESQYRLWLYKPQKRTELYSLQYFTLKQQSQILTNSRNIFTVTLGFKFDRSVGL